MGRGWGLEGGGAVWVIGWGRVVSTTLEAKPGVDVYNTASLSVSDHVLYCFYCENFACIILGGKDTCYTKSVSIFHLLATYVCTTTNLWLLIR